MQYVELQPHSFRNLDIPFGLVSEWESKEKAYNIVMKISDLPFSDLEDWRTTINPRDYNATNSVVKDMIKTYDETPELFLLKNRWITILADSVSYDKKDNKVILAFDEKLEEKLHWILDGWHTFKTLYNCILEENIQEEAYVRIEVIEWITERDQMIEIVWARNSSRNVASEDIQNLQHKFDVIKDKLEGEKYADKIAYKSSEIDAEWSKKNISIKDILSFMICFDLANYPDGENNPTNAYSAKWWVVNHFGRDENKESIEKITNILPEILKLSDSIYVDLPDVWNKELNGKFGWVKWIEERKVGKVLLSFIWKDSIWKIPGGYTYPILSSFRYLVRENELTGMYEWKVNPIEFWNKNKGTLVNAMKEEILRAKNPNAVWKDTLVWKKVFKEMQLITLEQYL